MIIIKKLSLVFLLILLSLLFVGGIFASNYGGCRYGYGLYGLGEDCGSGASGGSSGGGGGGGGSGSTATVTTQTAGTVNVETPDDLDDGLSSIFEFVCGSECETNVNEISTNTFLSETGITPSSGDELLGAVQLDCNGDVSTATASVSVDVSDDVNCDNLRVDFVSDDGVVESTDLNSCSKSGSTVSVSVSHSGCSYLAVWKITKAEVQPTTVAPVEEAPESVEEVQPTQQAVGVKKTWLLYLLLGVVVVLVVVFLVFKKKKK